MENIPKKPTGWVIGWFLNQQNLWRNLTGLSDESVRWATSTHPLVSKLISSRLGRSQLKMSAIRLSSVIMECAKCAKCAKYDQIWSNMPISKRKVTETELKRSVSGCVASVPPGMSSICWDNIFISMLCACTCASVKVRSSQSLCQLHGRSCRSCRCTPKKLSGRHARPCDLASRSDIHEELTPAIPEFRTAQLRTAAQLWTDQDRSKQIKTDHDKPWQVDRLIRLCALHKKGLRSGPFVPFACPSPHLGDTDSEWHRMAQIYLEISNRIQRLQILKPVTLKLTVLHHILLLLLENRVPY